MNLLVPQLQARLHQSTHRLLSMLLFRSASIKHRNRPLIYRETASHLSITSQSLKVWLLRPRKLQTSCFSRFVLVDHIPLALHRWFLCRTEIVTLLMVFYQWLFVIALLGWLSHYHANHRPIKQQKTLHMWRVVRKQNCIAVVAPTSIIRPPLCLWTGEFSKQGAPLQKALNDGSTIQTHCHCRSLIHPPEWLCQSSSHWTQ